MVLGGLVREEVWWKLLVCICWGGVWGGWCCDIVFLVFLCLCLCRDGGFGYFRDCIVRFFICVWGFVLSLVDLGFMLGGVLWCF